jgi:hypothetical protein
MMQSGLPFLISPAEALSGDFQEISLVSRSKITTFLLSVALRAPGGLDASTDAACRHNCWRNLSGISIAGIHERYAGNGHRGSHQLGKTPI